MVDSSRCPTCHRRYHAGRDNGGASDTLNEIRTELQKEDLTQQQRVELLCAQSKLQAECISNARDKRKAKKRKIQYRRPRTVAEKAARGKIRSRILTVPEVMPWSVDKIKILEKFPDKPIPPKPEEAAKAKETNAMANFFPSLKEEKPNATE